MWTYDSACLVISSPIRTPVMEEGRGQGLRSAVMCVNVFECVFLFKILSVCIVVCVYFRLSTCTHMSLDLSVCTLVLAATECNKEVDGMNTNSRGGKDGVVARAQLV